MLRSSFFYRRAPRHSAGVVVALGIAASLGASDCQIAGKKDKRPERCAACHMEDFRNAETPVHVGTRPAACGICHTQASWHPSVVAHTPWPLTGAHAKAKCFDCHTGDPPKLAGTPKACFGCHKTDFEHAPGHIDQKFSTKCDSCHKTTTWNELVDSPAEPTPPATTATSAPPRKPPPKPAGSGPGPRPSARPKALP